MHGASMVGAVESFLLKSGNTKQGFSIFFPKCPLSTFEKSPLVMFVILSPFTHRIAILKGYRILAKHCCYARWGT